MFGAFLLQLCAGSYNGRFGNLLPYFTSYMRQAYGDLTNGDLAMIFALGGLIQGFGFLFGGLILIPALGPRPSLLLGCLLYFLSPVLTYVCMVTWAPVETLHLTYGMLSSFAMNIIQLVTLTMPVSWFPEHRGKVIGFINCGFGLSATVFSPVQTVLVNPFNLQQEIVNNTGSISLNYTISPATYFLNQDLLDNIPNTMLYMSAIYGALFVIGLLITTEAPKDDTSQSAAMTLTERLQSAWLFMYKEASRSLDFHLLWLARFLYLTVGAGMLAHWKTFAFTQSSNDQIVAIAGGISGVVNCLTRIVSGFLIDKFGYSKLMSMVGILLTIDLVSVYYVGQLHFSTLIVAVWLVYFFAFAQFSTIPAQAHKLFGGPNISVVLGCIGLAQSFSYGALGMLNQLIMSEDSNDGRFLIFFLTLGGFSLLSVPTTWFVSNKRTTLGTGIFSMATMLGPQVTATEEGQWINNS